MSGCRSIAVWIVIILVTILTLNIRIEKQDVINEDGTTEFLRKKRAVGSKPLNVFGVCGGSRYGRNGWIASPNFPGSAYPSLTSCNWTINVFPRMVIRFDFVYMDMEDAPVQKLGGCTADYLIIRDGSKESDPLVGGQRYCGHSTPFNSVYSKTNHVRIYFSSDGDTEGQGFAIRWVAVDPPKPQFDCDFESVNGLCNGWEQSANDTFDWRTNNGPTQSGKSTATGPLTDRTKKTESGIYLYTEASGIRKGDNALLQSPYVRIRNKKGQCFRFWYHMRGETMGTLNVYKSEIVSSTNSTKELIFSKSGEQSRTWKRADINVTASDNRVQFIFEGIRGSSYKSDMAIDDIQLLKRPCPKPWVFVPTTRAPTTQMTRRTRPVTTRATTRRTTTRWRRPPTTPFATTTQANCFYRCKDVGNCIEEDYFCDGISDCLHREDEDGCSATTPDTRTLSLAPSEWSDWTSWTTCTVTCGSGRSERERTCIQGGPFACTGSSSEGAECNTHKCINWNDWVEWGVCTKSCGKGIHTRERTCNGGNAGQPGCIGPYVQVDFCNEQQCPKWSDWSQWSQCQATCGNGTISRVRTCQGQQDGQAGCSGNATEVISCTHRSLPFCSEWTEWSDFSACTRSCGVGRQKRSRQCQNKGIIAQGCSGSGSDEENCNTMGCPEWTEWERSTECSVTCGTGILLKTRKCLQDGIEAQLCPGRSVIEEDCTNELCRAWSDWTPWTGCTASCGTGFHARRRSCKMGNLRSVGCPGKSFQTGQCSKDPCPRWREWGNWQSCSRKCGGGTRERRRSCDGGAPNTGDCIGSDLEKEKCNVQSCQTTLSTTRKPPATPKRKTPRWGKWGKWNSCSKDCGLGTQQRRRSCIDGRIGRRGCRGKVKQMQDCNAGPCTSTPSTLKPQCFERNVAKAKNAGRKCPARCDADKKCGGTKKCVCDGMCGKTCQKPTKRCKDISSRKNQRGTKLECSSGNSVGSVCTFSCQNGYKLQGQSAVICQGTSKWTNEKRLPSCVASSSPPTASTKACAFRKKSHNSCCGNRSFNNRSAKCCKGKVSAGGRAATKCCAARPYDPRKRGCCKNKVFWMSKQKCKNGRVVKK